MNFKTVFDLASEKIYYFREPLPLAYLFLLIGTGLLLWSKRRSAKQRLFIKTRLLGASVILISAIFLFIHLGSQFIHISKAKRIMKSGQYSTVEGRPENYHPMPKEGHDTERFDIGGKHFRYSDYAIEFGYRNAASLGGVIRPENYYRITYHDNGQNNEERNRIIKIEIREQ